MAENANASFPPLSDVVSSALHALNDFHYTEPHLINHLQQQQQHHLYAASQPANSTFTQLSSPPVGYSQPPLQISTVQPPSLKRPRLQDAMYNQASYVQGPSSMSYIANMPSYNIPTGNRYSPLASDPDPDPDPEQGVANNNSPPPQPIKIPPIIIHDPPVHVELLQKIKDLLKHENFVTKVRGPYTEIRASTVEDFTLLRKHLSTKGLYYHTYRDPTKTTISVVLRNVPISYSEQEILEELVKKSLPVITVIRLTDSNRKPWPLCAVTLTKSAESRAIYELKELFNAIITVEERRHRPGPVQCRGCQLFGHTKKNCGNPPRCGKCAGPHATAECSSTDTKCSLCGKAHRSSSRDCEIYQNILLRKSLPTRNPTRQQVSQQAMRYHPRSLTPPRPSPVAYPHPPPSNPITMPQESYFTHRRIPQPSLSNQMPQYADVLKQPMHPPTGQPFQLEQFISHQIEHFFSRLMSQIIPSLTNSILQSIKVYFP